MTSGFLITWKVAVLASTAAFLAHLALCIANVELAYKLSAEQKQERELKERLTLLQLEAATLRQVPRIETVARGMLGMDRPPAARVILVGAGVAAAEARSAGRSR